MYSIGGVSAGMKADGASADYVVRNWFGLPSQ